MSEAELHVLRARLEGGIRNKAVRGELRKALPVGLVWGEEDGEIRIHPERGGHRRDRTRSYERFASCGSVRASGCGCAGRACSFPLQRSGRPSSIGSSPTTPRSTMC